MKRRVYEERSHGGSPRGDRRERRDATGGADPGASGRRCESSGRELKASHLVASDPPIRAGAGNFLEPVTLPDSGEYRVVIVSAGGSGSGTLNICDVVDAETPIYADGLPVPITVSTPGQNARLPFAGSLEQRMGVLVNVMSGLRILVVASGLVMVAACASPAHETDKLKIVVERVGDDGLTMRAAESIEIAARSSAVFELADEQTEDTLILRIPHNVQGRSEGSRTEVEVLVELMRGRESLGGLRSACWETDMARCASDLLDGAAKKARGKD